MTTVLLTPEAELDLEEIADYIAADNPRRAVSFVDELRDRCQEIATAPLAHAERHELGPGIRSCLHGRYLIFFTFDPDDRIVLIVRVLHGARNLDVIFGNVQ